jgi:3-hydroxyisobutyrate dehydrogenase-like beta-hydroxyacid dehydrogenase
VLEMSTVAPSTVTRLGEEVARTGATLLDAPVSGSVSVVEQGTLTIMVGGDATAQAKAQPVLDREGRGRAVGRLRDLRLGRCGGAVRAVQA